MSLNYSGLKRQFLFLVIDMVKFWSRDYPFSNFLQIASSLACAQRGWMNIEIDKIVCESCGACLSFVLLPSWTPTEG